MKKIGIIVNPHAKMNRKRKEDPVELYTAIGRNYVDVRSTKDLDEVSIAAKDFKMQGIDYLGISGGDGTLHHVLSSFIEVYGAKIPPVIVLRDGTMNNISKSFQLKGKGHQILERFVNALENDKHIKICYKDTIKADGKYCFIFGLGLAANFIDQYNEGGKTGPLKAVKVLRKGVLGGIIGNKTGDLFGRLKAEIFVDENHLWFDDFFGILAATVDNIGLGFKPLYRSDEKENSFHLVATGMKPMELIFRLNKFRSGKPLKHRLHFDDIANNMKIVCPNRYKYMMDGDTYETSGELNVEIGPRVGFVSI